MVKDICVGCREFESKSNVKYRYRPKHTMYFYKTFSDGKEEKKKKIKSDYGVRFLIVSLKVQ